MPLDPVETLMRLVAIPSVNPMGRFDVDERFSGETRLTDHLERLFQSLGLRTHRQPVAPGRDNLIARLEGEVPPERGGPLLLFDAHQDTVPVDHMTIDPWGPEVREGRLYGRGACDTKGGMAAMVTAIARLAEEQPPRLPTIVMACTVDEEYSLAGARALASSWSEGSGGLIPRAPDGAVIAEPTSLDVIVAHKGVVRWRCRCDGRAGHSSQSNADDNAVYKMARVVTALERYQRDVVAGLADHPLCGPCTMNVGTIHGGASINIVPDACVIELEMRFPPGATPETIRARLIDDLADRLRGDPVATHEPTYMQGPALSDARNGWLAERFSAVVTDVLGGCRQRAVPYATDAAFFSNASTPAVVFGPGSIEQAHTDDEWISVEQLRQAAEIFYRFAKAWTAAS